MNEHKGPYPLLSTQCILRGGITVDLSSPRTMELEIIPEVPRVDLEASPPAFKNSTSNRCSSCRCCTRNSSSRCYIMGLLPVVHTTVDPQPRIRALHGSSHLRVMWGLRPTILRVTLRTCRCEGPRPSLQTHSLHSLHRLHSRTRPKLNRHLHLQNPPR